MSSNTQQTPFIKSQSNAADNNRPYIPSSNYQNTNSYTIKPVFDVTNFGTVQRFYISDPTATLNTVVNSTTTRANQFSSGTAPFQPVKDLDVVISNTDSMPLAGYANNTDMSQTFVVIPLTDSYLTAIKFNLAFGLNVSVAGAGTVTFSRVTVTVKWLDSGETFFDTLNVNTGLTGIAAATGTQLFYFNQDLNVNPDFRIYAGRPIAITLTTVSSDTAAATRQMGLYPNFSIHKQLSPAVPIQYTESFVDFHFYPALDNGQQSLTDALQNPNSGRRLDYSGLSTGYVV